ncbi:MAG: hypothetical protein AB7K64_17740 [Variibacter sp.]
MTELQNTLIVARRQNIARYNRLLHTKLTEAERRYVRKRIAQERAELEHLKRQAAQMADMAPVIAAQAGPRGVTPSHA